MFGVVFCFERRRRRRDGAAELGVGMPEAAAEEARFVRGIEGAVVADVYGGLCDLRSVGDAMR